MKIEELLDNIYNMDCLEGMKQIPDGSIDAIICDLPYGTTRNQWDSVIPLDNCMGSGTTAIACIKERRHFIGFELSKEYFDKACKRINAEQAQLTLF